MPVSLAPHVRPNSTARSIARFENSELSTGTQMCLDMAPPCTATLSQLEVDARRALRRDRDRFRDRSRLVVQRPAVLVPPLRAEPRVPHRDLPGPGRDVADPEGAPRVRHGTYGLSWTTIHADMCGWASQRTRITPGFVSRRVMSIIWSLVGSARLNTVGFPRNPCVL